MMVKCKRCRVEYATATQLDEKSFETENIPKQSEPCPKCGNISTYDKEDYFFK